MLPITSYRDRILSAVSSHPAVIITAETGAGKSTQVPQYLLAAGYNIVVTQPRKVAARTISARVASEMNQELGQTIGLRTRDDRVVSNSNRCLFCTDGLALIRELMGKKEHNVLVLDEVHEWNLNMEVLVAWAKLQITNGAPFKLVLMSATLESAPLSQFFGGAPVIEVPGRLYPIEVQPPSRTPEDDVVRLLRQGRNVLAFQPGKPQISKMIKELEDRLVNAEILPLHGEQTVDEQDECFKHYGRPKCIVATNVAQTSITIDDIDAVVDTGMERRQELVNGVEGTYIKPISLAHADQRKGRAGRNKPGIYIDHCPASDRSDFPVAEIMRTRLDQTVLRLAEAGFDAEELEFFHQPNKSEIHEARRALKALGCMNEDGTVTKIGHRVALMPISVQYARMIIEAERLGVVDDVITIAALLEIGGITDKDEFSGWRSIVQNEKDSDVMAQLAVYKAAENMGNDKKKNMGIIIKAFHKVRDLRTHLQESLVGMINNFESSGDRERILRAVCSGYVDHLFRLEGYSYKNGNGQPRQLNRYSVVKGAEWLVGKPFDLQFNRKVTDRYTGDVTEIPTVVNLIIMATKVDPTWLVEIAPQLVREEAVDDPRYEPGMDQVVCTTLIKFKEQMVKMKLVPYANRAVATRIFALWLADQTLQSEPDTALMDLLDQDDFAERYGIRTRTYARTEMTERPALDIIQQRPEVIANIQRERRARELNQRTSKDVFVVHTREQLTEWFSEHLGKATCFKEVADPSVLLLPALPADLVQSFLAAYPDEITVLDRRLPVEYPVLVSPRITVTDDETHWWKDLPNSGVFLPDGRSVDVTVVVPITSWGITRNWSYGNNDIPNLKAKVREQLNTQQWESWKYTRRGYQRLERSEAERLVNQPQTVVYGTCIITGEDLVAYGAVQTSYLWSGDVPRFESTWSRDKKEADEININTRQELRRTAPAPESEAIQSTGGTYNDLKKAPELQKRAETLLQRNYGRLNDNDRRALQELHKSKIPLMGLDVWVKKADATLTQIEGKLKK